MNGFDFAEFHFLRPEWLLAILPLFLLVYALRHIQKQQSGWQSLLASHLYQYLVDSENGGSKRPPWMLLALGWLLASIALAGPTWERLPQPVYQLHEGKVVLIDMSMSMRATDITPNRLTRSRFKAIDLINQLAEGETGLVAYAGDAFVISPLSTDMQNLTALIPSLSPEIMPVPGSEPLYGLETATELLSKAGYQQGDIFWITDGIEAAQVAPIREFIDQQPFRVNILAVGTEDGAPIELAGGGLLQDSRGSIVVPKLNTGYLRGLASATGGRLVTLQNDDGDIEFLTNPRLDVPESEKAGAEEEKFGDEWQESGPYIVLLLLPIAAVAFRRGLMVVLLGLLSLPMAPKPAYANWWDDLWQTQDQQAMKAFNQEQFQQAAEQFDNPLWKGTSAYRQGEFQDAADHFASFDTDESNYNLGNSLAQLGDLQGAIDAYKRSLNLNPEHQDAAANKALLEKLLQQQQQQDQQNQQGSDSENQEGENQEGDQQQGDQQQNQDGSSQEQQQDSQQGDQQGDQQEQQGQQDQQQGSESQQDQQDSQNQQGQSEQQGEQSEQESSSSAEEQQAQEQREQQQAQQGQETQEGEEGKEGQQAAAMEQRELTEEEKEQQQKMQNWLRKVPDDPAYLLKRKMQLEQQRRRRQTPPGQAQRNW